MPQCQHPPPSQAHVDVSKATIIDPAQVLVDSPEPWATKMITGLYEARKKKGMTEEQEATCYPGLWWGKRRPSRPPSEPRRRSSSCSTTPPTSAR